jgi:tetratricopeptide (TPR) repeat protein
MALLGISFFYYLYAFGYTSSKLVAFGLFEGYHDIQYLAIVWIFNRNRAEKDSDAGTFTRFLFRQRGLLIVLYVMMCLGFGSYDYFARSLNEGQLARAALGVITGLALVHFYFDGFIWRIREAETRSTLGVEGGDARARRSWLPKHLRHGLLWVVIALPVMVLGVWEIRGGRAEDATACRMVLDVRPDSHKAHYMIGSLARKAGNLDEALEHARRCRELRPGYDLYEMLYADVLMARPYELSDEKLDEVIRCYRSAAKTRSNEPQLQLNWGKALALKGDAQEATLRYTAAFQLDPQQADPQYEIGILAAQQQDLAAASHHLTEAIRIDPNHIGARSVLAAIQLAQGRAREALSHYNHVLKLEPDRVRALTSSATILANVEDEQLRDLNEARRRADRALQLSRESDTLRDAALVFAAVGDFDKARSVAQQATQSYQQAGQENLVNAMNEAIERYQQGRP